MGIYIRRFGNTAGRCIGSACRGRPSVAGSAGRVSSSVLNLVNANIAASSSRRTVLRIVPIDRQTAPLGLLLTPLSNKVTDLSMILPSTVETTLSDQGFSTMADAPSRYSQLWDNLSNAFHLGFGKFKAWSYEIVCEETKMQDTCKKVGDTADSVWTGVKSATSVITGVPVAIYRFATLDWWPFNSSGCDDPSTICTWWPCKRIVSEMPNICQSVRTPLKVILISGLVIGCLAIYSRFIRKPYSISVKPQPVVVNNYLVASQNPLSAKPPTLTPGAFVPAARPVLIATSGPMRTEAAAFRSMPSTFIGDDRRVMTPSLANVHLIGES